MSERYQLKVSKNSSVKELQRLLDNAGVPWSDCMEKHDLVNLALEEEAKVLSYLRCFVAGLGEYKRSEQGKMSERYFVQVSKNSSVKELQRLLDNAGVPWSDCVEKHDLVNLALEEEAKVLPYLKFEARNTSEVARNTSEVLQRSQSAGEIKKNPEQLEQDMRRRVTDEARNRGMRFGTPNSTRERGAQRPGQLVSQLAADCRSVLFTIKNL
jgi:hypothetical protein